ncbi:MAG: hypothetical protein ACE5G2_02525 [Candidatus Krumholzibacteriia bacterium]
MSLRDLPAGLPPDEVEKLRWETFAHKRAFCLKSVGELLRFTRRRGFVLLRPARGIHYPSVMEAAVGRPLLDFTWDEKVKQVEGWKLNCITSRRVVRSAVVAGCASLLSPVFLSHFYALSGNRGDLHDHKRRHQSGALTPEAAGVCQVLARRGRLAAGQLASELRWRGEHGRLRLESALGEALRRLLVVEVEGSESDPETGLPVPAYDLLPRVCQEQVCKGRETDPQTARQRIVCRYLRNVIVEDAREMAHVLGWSAAETLTTLQALVSKHMATAHPSSRYNRHLFQATATDLLQAPPARGRPKEEGA